MANNKYSILVAEDDHFLRKVYQTKLTQEGFLVDIAVDGEEALKKLRVKQPSLLLLDLVMPKVNGFDVLEEMKDDRVLKKVPVIVLSNLGQSDDIQRTRELGAKDYLVKANFSINEVVTKIRDFLSKEGVKPSASAEEPAVESPKEEKDSEEKKATKSGTKKCDHCGKSIPEGSKFCPYCGKELKA